MAERCPELETSLDRSEASLVLEPYFVAVRELFVEKGFERCQGTRLGVSGGVRTSVRHFAACREDGGLILVAPEMVELSSDLVIGILGHEFGHATDFLYPGEFFLRDGRAERRSREEAGEKQWARWLRVWQAVHASEESRDQDEVERVADAIAEAVLETPIGYAGPCRLQSIGGGERPRPRGLR